MAGSLVLLSWSLACTFCVVVAAARSQVVETSVGRLRGHRDVATGARAYLAIPFAQQPVGPRRFMPPLPLRRDGDFVLPSLAGPACPQVQTQSMQVVCRGRTLARA
jgi:acetylcholinesterase